MFSEDEYCFGCGKSGHNVRDCLMIKAQVKESNQEQASAPNSNAPKKNHFYALRSRGDQEESLDVVPVCYKCFPLMSMFY